MKKNLIVTLLLFTAIFTSQAKDVYVATYGSDLNSGSSTSPFRTIQRGVDALSKGETCYIREGIYREQVKINKSDVTLKAYEDEHVAIYGSQIVTNWEQFKDSIYRAPASDLEPQFTQLIYNKKIQHMARYPDNTSHDMFAYNEENGYTGLESKANGKVIFDKPLPGGKDYWKGGYFRAIAAKRGGATNPQGRISSNEGREIQCDEMNNVWTQSSKEAESSYLAIGKGDGYIFHFNALSTAGEWWHQNDSIYFWQPDGIMPAAESVEVQKYNHVIIAKDQENIILDNINVRLAAVQFENCDNCIINKCSFRDLLGWVYQPGSGMSFTDFGGPYINGKNIEITNCYFTKSWGNLLNLCECDGVLVDNCVFENNGWMALFTSQILSDSDNLTVTNCEFGSSGRFHIRSDGHHKLIVKHNEFFDCMKISEDAGSIELTNSGLLPDAMNMQGSEFAYNSFHDMNTLKSFAKYKTQFVAALYFEGADNYTVHHNLFYNITNGRRDATFVYLGPRYSKLENCLFYNNTVWNISLRIRIWNFIKGPYEGGIKNALFYNNIFTAGMRNRYQMDGPSLESSLTFKSNLELPLSDAHLLFKDTRNDDFTLEEGSPAIDGGMIIPGYTDGFKGAAPDLGCYESGVEPWKFGSTLKVHEVFPDEEW